MFAQYSSSAGSLNMLSKLGTARAAIPARLLIGHTMNEDLSDEVADVHLTSPSYWRTCYLCLRGADRDHSGGGCRKSAVGCALRCGYPTTGAAYHSVHHRVCIIVAVIKPLIMTKFVSPKEAFKICCEV